MVINKGKCIKKECVQAIDITPELTEEEIINRANFIIEGLLQLHKETHEQ